MFVNYVTPVNCAVNGASLPNNTTTTTTIATSNNTSINNNNTVTTPNNTMQSSQKDTTLTKIFVGGLPYHTTDKSLKKFFESFGDIEEAVVITDRQTGKSRGYGFVSSILLDTHTHTYLQAKQV